MRRTLLVLVVATQAAFAFVGAASAEGNAKIAALQIALHERGLYSGTIDGIAGAGTSTALRSLQASSGPIPHGTLGPYTPRALGSRTLEEPMVGYDVGQLQWELAWHGFPSGVFDGRFGRHLTRALERFQRFAGLTPDGIAGPATVAELARPLDLTPPHLVWPVAAPLGDRYGPRGDRFHAGIDLRAAAGDSVRAAAAGVVTWAGVRTGWGLCVVVAHGGGVRTLYAHLGSTDVDVATRVQPGTIVGLVGSTGDATGPHLHFEVRIRGAAIDPLLALR
jgi:murein DD-endopeptidase MepM/ murein hydrolase activator NlpD